MVLVVSGVSFLIHVYSTADMESDGGLRALLRVTSTSSCSRCCLLVLASNFVLLIVGWGVR